MVNAWEVGTMVAVVGGVVGFFVVLRGSAFPAHAIPNGAFAGAAGANLVAINPLIGLGVFSFAAALGIGALSRRGRSDAVTALALVMMLALGAAFLSLSTQYEPQIFSLLFGEILGVSSSEILPVVVLGVVCIVAVSALYRPLLLTSIAPGRRRRTRAQATTPRDRVPHRDRVRHHHDGAGRRGAPDLHVDARSLGGGAVLHRPRGAGMAGSVAIALATIWLALACAYETNWPVGFYVSIFSAAWYGVGRGYAAWRARQRMQVTPAAMHDVVVTS